MPIINGLITAEGPVIDVVIWVSNPRYQALKKANQPVPPIRRVRALIDTGASATAVDSSIIQSLGLPATGCEPIHTPSSGATPAMCNLFDVSISLTDQNRPHFLKITLPVIEFDLSLLTIDALLGRDVLESCLMNYNGITGQFTLATS